MRLPPAAPWGHTKHMQKHYRYTEITHKHTHTLTYSHTHMYTPPWLWGPAMNHGCLHIHPSWLVLLSDFTGVCRLQSRMFMVLSCHVLCSLLSHCGVKEGIDYVENCPPPHTHTHTHTHTPLWNIQVMIGNFKRFRFNQLCQASFLFSPSFLSFFFLHLLIVNWSMSIHTHQVSWALFSRLERWFVTISTFIPPRHAWQTWRIVN